MPRGNGITDNISSDWFDAPSNPKIKINSPTVGMQSDWEIGRIAVTDNGGLDAWSVDYQVFYDPLYD